MKKHYQLIFISFLFFAVATKGQPILTNANTSFQIGEIYRQISVDYVPEGSAGADVIWDFSNLNALDTNLFTGADESMFSGSDAFPNATVYLYIPQMYSQVYSATDTTLELLGYASLYNPVVWQNPQIMLTYPFTFNSSKTDLFYCFDYGQGISNSSGGSDTITADAYGTMILPSGTYEDVLRVKVVEDYEVEVNGNGFFIYHLNTYYKWYKPGEHFPIFTSWSTVVNEGNPSYFSTYLKSTTIGLKDFNINKSLSISPNPAQSSANVTYELTNAATVKISLVNGIGQIVEEEIFPSQTNGKYNFTFDVTKYSRGLYTVNLKIDNQLISKKLVVE